MLIENGKIMVEADLGTLEYHFENYAKMAPMLGLSKDGDGRYEDGATWMAYSIFEYAFKKGIMVGVIQNGCDKIDGQLCDRIAELEKELVSTKREANYPTPPQKLLKEEV